MRIENLTRLAQEIHKSKATNYPPDYSKLLEDSFVNIEKIAPFDVEVEITAAPKQTLVG